MGLCFKIIEIWNLFDILDFVYWNFWFIQVRLSAQFKKLPYSLDCSA